MEVYDTKAKKITDILVGCLLSLLIFSPMYLSVNYIAPNSGGQSTIFESLFGVFSVLLIILGTTFIAIVSVDKKRKLILAGYLLIIAIIIATFLSSRPSSFWEFQIGW